MKKILISLLILPCFAFSCQECIDSIRDKIDRVSDELIVLILQEKQNTAHYYFLYGKMDAYYDALKITEKHLDLTQ